MSGLTGAGKGSCQPVSGTAYLGGNEQVNVCGAIPAQVSESDFPQPLDDASLGAFSVDTPNHASTAPVAEFVSGVTGTNSEQGRISGTFSLGEGKVTGTEQFRSGNRKESPVALVAMSAANVEEAKVLRITGEGLSSDLKITGNDWARSEQVTGTEGRSATLRNQIVRGPISARPESVVKRNEDVPPSDSKVTGGSGNTEKGAMVTLSGGARG